MKNFDALFSTLSRTTPTILFALVTGIFFTACRQQSAADWPGMKKMIREKFPEVRQISPAQLSEWLAQSQPPLLFDARAPKEFAVSHLRDAKPAENEQQALDQLNNTPKDRQIVIYCSVGYRSSVLAQKLQQAGYMNVFNLEGSIFEWANEGRPVFQNQQQVKTVHPFDEKWGTYLNKDLWSPLTSPAQ